MIAVQITRPGEVKVVNRSLEPVGKGQARVRLEAGGVCGSDLAAYAGTSPMVRYPRVIGHELVGVVTMSGDEGAVPVGARVVVEPMLACGRCYACSIGRYNCCEELRVMGVHEDGGFASEFTVPLQNLHRVPDGMPVDAAVLVEPLTIGLQALYRGRIDHGERVVIFGAGTIGLLILQAAVNYFGAEAAVVDIRGDRLEIAERLGAFLTINSAQQDVVEQIRSWSKGQFAPLVIEVTGHPACNEQAIKTASYAGRVVLVGWNSKPIVVDTIQAMRKELDILGSRNSRCMFPEAIEVLASGHIDYQEMITHRLRLTEAEQAFALLQDDAVNTLKIVLYP